MSTGVLAKCQRCKKCFEVYGKVNTKKFVCASCKSEMYGGSRNDN